jgi:hypothetical protein
MYTIEINVQCMERSNTYMYAIQIGITGSCILHHNYTGLYAATREYNGHAPDAVHAHSEHNIALHEL